MTPAPAPTNVGQEVPASGRAASGSGVGVFVGAGVLVGVGVLGPAGTGVGEGVGDGEGVGEGVGDGVGEGVAVAVAVDAVKVKDRAVHEEGTAAAGLDVGAVGATASCLN